MSLSAAVRPDRVMAFPFLAVLFPALWFIYRDASGVDGLAVSLPRLLASVAAAVVASYIAAVLVAPMIRPAGAPPVDWLQTLLAPSNGTLAAVAGISALLTVFLLADATGVVPRWLTTALAPFGVLIGWPVPVAIAATYAVGNALGTELPFLVQAGFLVVGIVCTVAWLFVLSSRLVSLAERRRTSKRSQTS